MNLYEFGKPSDKITFYADNDKIAYLATVILSDGDAGCENLISQEILPTILILSKEPAFDIEQFLEEDASVFYENNKAQIAATFNSFAYASQDKREAYDKAFELICNDEELESFRYVHDKAERTSSSPIVFIAWNKADAIKKVLEKALSENKKKQDEQQA